MTRVLIPGDELLKKARSVGQYYGFTPFVAMAAERRGTRAAPPEAGAISTVPPPPPEALDPVGVVVAGLLAQCRKMGIALPPGSPPLFLWHSNLTPGRPTPKRAVVQFHAIGTERTLAEAVIIRALMALTRDLFHSEPVVRINSMGDRETRARYVRELGTFFKRRAATLPEECLIVAKKDAFAAAELAIARECAENLPSPTEYLSDASRKRFEDLLEYLEATETPYELARDLMSRGTHWNDTCFEIVLPALPAPTEQTGLPASAAVAPRRVAWGSRYNELAKHMFGQATGAMGAVLSIETSGSGTLARIPAGRTRFVFVHIGEEAKRLSLRLAEEFKHAHLPLTQDIGIESLTEQMRLAERRDPPYLLIMGRKEALEGTVLLRDRRTQEELVLPVLGLTERLKSIA
ncbi:MAG: His/Gly/Thr/Pro-type tRNA ligase C-terminal domain-containing protein [bacterium]|nr:His/Gly/Thr/Pro-type tRNA ligase C-terminal domain-containing protein [bacterium]